MLVLISLSPPVKTKSALIGRNAYSHFFTFLLTATLQHYEQDTVDKKPQSTVKINYFECRYFSLYNQQHSVIMKIQA